MPFGIVQLLDRTVRTDRGGSPASPSVSPNSSASCYMDLEEDARYDVLDYLPQMRAGGGAPSAYGGDSVIPVEIAPYLTVASMAASVVMTVTFWVLRGSQEKRRERHVRRAISNHVADLVRILEGLYGRAEGAERGEREAKAACAYFARHAQRLEALRLSVENLLPELDQNDRYVGTVRRILDVETWLIDRYHDPTVPEGARFNLWTSGAHTLGEKTRAAVEAATSLSIVKPVTID